MNPVKPPINRISLSLGHPLFELVDPHSKFGELRLEPGVLSADGLQGFNPDSLRDELLLLFFDGVDQHDRDAIVLNTFDLPFAIAGHQQRLDRSNIFGCQPKIQFTVGFPGKGDRIQPPD